jgi:hypothetical protein
LSKRYDNLHYFEDNIEGSNFEIYTYKFPFYDIELNTPFEVCIGTTHADTNPEKIQGKGYCKSFHTTTDNGHIPVEMPLKEAVNPMQ